MANLSVASVQIDGIFSCLPQQKQDNLTNPLLVDPNAFIAHTGIRNRYIAGEDERIGNYFLQASQKGMAALNWVATEIQVIICVSQTPDQAIPSCANQLHAMLGAPDNCICLDINQGCSGYVYGLSVVSQYLEKLPGAKALLCVGDFSSRLTDPRDASTQPVFSDAATVSFLRQDYAALPMHFSLSSIGKGIQAINMEPNTTNELKMKLNGIDVFSLSVQHVPSQINELLAQHPAFQNTNTALILHQANQVINQFIEKKLAYELNSLSSIAYYGNTSSASIPLTICHAALTTNADQQLCLCGFGVGFSIASALLTLPASCKFFIFDYE
jgi:3-oxoacyl-[acyl-carrier-protein] synthase-3